MCIGLSLAVLWGAIFVWLLLLITGRIVICNYELHKKNCANCANCEVVIKDQQTEKPEIGM